MDILDIAVSSITFLTLREKILLRKNIDSLDKLAVLSKTDICQIVGRASQKSIWNSRETIILAQKGLKLMESLNISSVRYDSCEYPALLRETLNAPYLLFYRGNLNALSKRCVSVVGTRNVSKSSAQAAFTFAKDAALAQCCVVSGLAYGVDSFAHKGALASEHKASTVAVIPSGIDTVVPYGNRKLLENILRNDGLVLSEYIPGCPAESWRFVQRNRIIAALSAATVVIHAPCASGALITADFALDFNRDLFFHSAGFEEDSLRISKARAVQLEHSMSRTDVLKLERAPEKYVADGASVIDSFADFQKAFSEPPGTHICKNKQLSLFEMGWG